MGASSERQLEEQEAEERMRDAAPRMLAALTAIKKMTEEKREISRYDADEIWRLTYFALPEDKP
jgi:hypothetical protein